MRSNKYPSRKRTLLLITLAGVLFYGGYQGWLWWLRHEPLGSAAQKIVDAYDRRDLNTLWYYSDQGEKESFHMDRKKFEDFFKNYVWKDASPLPVVRTTRDSHPSSDVFTISRFYRDGDREIFLDIVVFGTGDGPKTNIISPCVHMTFDRKYGKEFSSLSGAASWYATRLRGSLRDRKELERFGITGVKDNAPESPMTGWDRNDAILSEFLVSKGITVKP